MTARLFDIMLPFYGDVGLMRTAVHSVLAQSGGDWHLTVLDDQYPDPTVAEWFRLLGDPRVTYRRNEVNLGANRNFAQAVSLATAPHLVVMGCDDVMLPGYLEHMRTMVARFPAAAVIQPGVTVIDGQGRSVTPLTDKVKQWSRPRSTSAVVLEGDALAASLLRGNWTYFPSLCWRTAVVRDIGFRPGYDVVQDLALLMDITLGGGSLALDHERTTFAYRRHADSLSAVRAVTGDRFREEAEYFRMIARECATRGWRRAERSARSHLTSRLHALTLLPAAVSTGSASVSARLLGHAFSR